MANQTTGGGPCFPSIVRHPNDYLENKDAGLSRRDYFAAAALPELIKLGDNKGASPIDVANDCAMYADAVLDVLDRKIGR